MSVPAPTSHFDWHEGSGSTTTSLVGGYTLTVSNWASRQSVGSIGPSVLSDNWTLFARVTLTQLSGSSGSIFNTNSGNNEASWINIDSERRIGVWPDFNGDPLPEVGVPFDLAIVGNDDNVRFFVDGVQIASDDTFLAFNPGSGGFSVMRDVGLEYDIEELRFWNSALTDAQVMELSTPPQDVALSSVDSGEVFGTPSVLQTDPEPDDALTEANEKLDAISQNVEDYRYELDVMRRAKPQITFYRNKAGNGPLGPADGGGPGLEYYGRVVQQDTIRASFPFKKNVSAQGVLELRFDHYIAEWLRTIPNDPEQCKNVVIRVDMFGGKLRWTGLLHHWEVKEDAEGIVYMECVFHDDLQFLQFLLGPPNPALPIPIFQFPRVLPIFGPAKWACSIMVLINLLRNQAPIYHLPDDPFDFDQWIDILPSEWKDWQCHVKCNPLPLDDSSLWTVLGTRMNPIDSVLSEALEDAQLTIRYRRVFTDEGETENGVLFVEPDQFANGALVFEFVDDSGYYDLLRGTFLSGTIASGMVRSVVQWVGGFIEDTIVTIADDETMYPDEYWGPGFLGTLASAPWLVIRDSAYTPVGSRGLSWAPATAVSAVVGGGNPIADAIARLIIETTGNILGYFLLGGFSSAGTIAADLIMPFLEGTIAAWLEWKNIGRANQLGWCHLFELYQQGAESNAWSLSAIAALRGAFLASRSETSHTVNLRGTNWVIPGVDFTVGSRVGHTMRGFEGFIFVNQCEAINVQWDNTGEDPFTFECTFGQNKAAMSSGERTMRVVKRLADIVHNIGVHLVS
ncbi:minor tail protein [Mycobacterium phage Azrael100]|nr:minor tail protein [Mycobacterium phage Azrael100]